jgi:putative hydrolase of the HAD superfamily
MFTESESLWDGIEGIVLDAVGTLIEPGPPPAEVYRAAARRQGVDLPAGEVRARFHRQFRHDEVDEALGPMRTDEALEARRWRRIVAAVLPEVPDVERAFQELWAYFARPEAWRCFPDVGPAVRALLSWGMKVRIGSNFDTRLRAVVAGLPELSALADALVISSEVGLRKPHPGFYQAACASMGLDPGRVLWIGDDPDNDVLGPQRAGLRGVLLDRAGRRTEGEIGGLRGLAGLGELVAARKR